MSQKGLGRGLSALFGEDTVKAVTSSAASTQVLRLSMIEPNPNQPRRAFDEEKLAELADSIKANGLIQPIAVRKNGDGYYTIIAGERRWRAARLAGLTEVPVTVIDADDRHLAELALIENLQREDLNPIEEAEGYETLRISYGLTQEDIASTVGRSRPAVANALRLLALPEEVRTMVIDGTLSAGHARTLLALPDGEKMLSAAKIAVESGMSVRALENYVKKLLTEQDEPKSDTSDDGVNYFAAVEETLSSRLGRKVTFRTGKKRGKVEIEYYGAEDLEALIELLSKIQTAEISENDGK